MKAFKIYDNTKHIFNIIASTFPKIKTLLFNNNNTERLLFYCTMQLFSFVSIKYKCLFSINESLTNLYLLCVNVITPIKTKISITFSSISYIQTLIDIENTIGGNLINNIKIAFSNSNNLKITSNALVGTFNYLGDFDPLVLGTMDPEILGDLDFNSV